MTKNKNQNQPPRPKANDRQTRVLPAEFRAVEGAERTFELSFSSEDPVSRWYGTEILLHDEGSVDLSRMEAVGTVLFSHGRDPQIGRMPIAKIDKCWLDAGARKCRALITFDAGDPVAEKICGKVSRGMLTGVSVGYAVDSWEQVKPGAKSSNGRFTGPCDLAIRWSPIEISLEPTPADATVGVGRSIEENQEREEEEMTVTNNPANPEERGTGQTPSSGVPAPAAMSETPSASRTEEQIRREAAESERSRIQSIRALAETSNVDLADFINNGRTLEEARNFVLDEMLRNQAPVSSGSTGSVEVRGDADFQFRAAASDAILMRGAIRPQKPVEGAEELRGMSLRDLAIECLERAGETKARRLTDSELFRRAVTPDSQFSAILSDSVNKSMSAAYQAQQPTFSRWTGKGSNRDFKKATYYRLSEAGNLERVRQNGELKFDEMTDESASTQVLTYGKRFGFTREAMINDDLGVLTRVPQRYVASALRGANQLVYKILNENAKTPDGLSLFLASHKNLGTAGALSVSSLGEARKLMRTQKNIAGKETLNIAPKFLLVPPALETLAQQLLRSIADPASSNSAIVNPFYSSLDLIVDAELNEASTSAASAWYLAADPAMIDTIVVSYLNGQESPILESRIGFDFLGIEWRIIYDIGVDLMDFRGLVKNAGGSAS